MTTPPPSDPLAGDSHTGDPDEPPTESSATAPIIPIAPKSIPDHGVWVGPREEPARFERLNHVGGGAEGVVYHARFVGLGSTSTRLVALKEFRRPAGAPRNWPHDGTWLQLSDQAGLLTGLPTPDHLVKVMGTFLGAVSSRLTDRSIDSPNKTFETPYLVMEWIGGLSPTQAMAARDVPLAERCGWVRDLASAVDLLHSVSRPQGNPLVHGDIKPGNCLITATRGLVLVDTGAMTRLDAAGTHRGLCTPPYAAPEVLAAPGRPRIAGADPFSVGAVAYLLLTGTPPPTAGADDYLDEAGRRLDSAFLDMPAAGAHIARRLLLDYLAPDPAHRIRTNPIAWSQQLSAALTAHTLARRPLRRRRRAVAAVAAAAVTASVDVGAALAQRGHGIVSWAPGSAAPSVSAGAASHAASTAVPALDRDVGGTFTVFDRRWATFPASVDDRTLTITTPTGANAFDHLWGFYLPVEVCSTTVEFDAQVQAADGMGDYGIGIAPRSSLVGDQPTGYSVQYEWEGSDINADPGTYVRPSGLPARAWAIEVDPAPAPDLRQRRHVKVSALGTALTIGIDGRDVAQYELPQADCGGVTIRSWGARASFSNVCVTGL